MNWTEKLLEIASAPTLTSAPQSVGNPALEELLRRKNGFYAFESALHVFPAGSSTTEPGIREWNAASGWRSAYGSLLQPETVFFAEDIFGNQFGVRKDEVFFFDAETGNAEPIANSIDGWCELVLKDFNVQTGYPIAHAWQKKNGVLSPRLRLIPKIPFVLGGEFTVENVYASDAENGMRLRGDVALQLKDLPDNAKIKIKIVE